MEHHHQYQVSLTFNFRLYFIRCFAKGLGFALYQIQEDQLRVLGYGSRTLVAAGNKYHSFKLKFLAIKWSICKHFRDHLYYSPHFHVYTDLNPVLQVNKQWLNELSKFNFSIQCKPGIENVVTDSPSGYPLLQECNLEQYSQHLNPDEAKSAFDAVVYQVANNET